MAGAAELRLGEDEDGAPVGLGVGGDLQKARRDVGRAMVALASCSTAWNDGRSWLLRRAPAGFDGRLLRCTKKRKKGSRICATGRGSRRTRSRVQGLTQSRELEEDGDSSDYSGEELRQPGGTGRREMRGEMEGESWGICRREDGKQSGL